ncbi:MAG: thiamine pyrophosphate-binding protein [Dehalococcoidia bacterium]|nr:thiamine pyrophosphate-binding protein [Dehalococcoidia bacterium]
MPMMTGGRFMAETLHGYGVTHVFFVPVIIQRAMLEMEKLGIKRILTHGEKAAAYMADGYARASHKPGVCAAQNVGAANLAAGLQDPFLAGSPVLAITGRKPRLSQHRNSYQEVDHLRPFSAVTKYSVPVDSAEQLPFLLRQALREATSGAPGPVHLDLEGTSGNIVMEGEADLEVIIEENFTRVPAYRPEPEAAMVRAAAQVLSAAQRPVIVAGGGVTASGAQQEVVQLAEMMSIPVATSLNAKTAIPDGHRLSVGVCGSYSRTCANRLVSEADLVLYIGSHTGSQVTNEWTVPSLDTPVIQIDIDPSELGRSYPAKATLQGDAKACLRRLMEVLEPLGPRTEWVNRAQELVAEWREGVSEVANSDGSPIRPERLCKELTDFLPSDAVLISDTGHSGIWTGTMIDLKEQTQQYIRCAGSLGWGFPGALGAKCALPDRPVICFTGDGGFWYHMSELETALRYGINAVIVVNNNHSLNQEKRSNDRLYAGQPGNPEELWHMLDVDLAKLAQTIGCFGIRVDQPGQIQSALEQAIASGKPAVVDVVTDIEGIAPPAWRP